MLSGILYLIIKIDFQLPISSNIKKLKHFYEIEKIELP